MPWANSTAPNLADYQSFLSPSGVVGIPSLNLPDIPYALVSLSWSNGIVTATTVSPLPPILGGFFYTAIAAAVPSGYNGTGLLATVLGANTFTYPVAVNPGTETSAGTFTLPEQVTFDTLSISMQIVNDALNVGVCNSMNFGPSIYVLAIYNLGADRLINFAQDVSGQTFFQDRRKAFRLGEVSVGVPSQVSDQGTATGILNPEQLELLTLQDLQTLRTPYGRQYMAFAQMWGRGLWGLT